MPSSKAELAAETKFRRMELIERAVEAGWQEWILQRGSLRDRPVSYISKAVVKMLVREGVL